MMKKIISVETMDRLQKKMGNWLQSELEEKFYKVEIAYLNLGYDTKRGFTVYIYENDYDYKQIGLNFVKDVLDVTKYVETVLYVLENGEYHTHEASVNEKFIIDLLKENKVKNMFVIDGEIYGLTWDIDPISICTIEEITYNVDNSMLYITIDEGYKYKYALDFINDGIIELETEEDEEKDIEHEIEKLPEWLEIADRDIELIYDTAISKIKELFKDADFTEREINGGIEYLLRKLEKISGLNRTKGFFTKYLYWLADDLYYAWLTNRKTWYMTKEQINEYVKKYDYITEFEKYKNNENFHFKTVEDFEDTMSDWYYNNCLDSILIGIEKEIKRLKRLKRLKSR
ncbi:hypothetical protein [Anaerophilus nitritogenes]|uniref:hypothetical protein n=1 Tax=Anaerophilus nitritogenes TaxID=2498136 RepID=UPI00101C336A|nr:hypothetical protein [Anaerophilus nitritogenes]